MILIQILVSLLYYVLVAYVVVLLVWNFAQEQEMGRGDPLRHRPHSLPPPLVQVEVT